MYSINYKEKTERNIFTIERLISEFQGKSFISDLGYVYLVTDEGLVNFHGDKIYFFSDKGFTIEIKEWVDLDIDVIRKKND